MATMDQSGTSAELMNSEENGIQLMISEVEDNEAESLADCENMRISSSSDSSVETADVPKDNPGSPKAKEADWELQGSALAIAPGIHGHRHGPRLSSQEAVRFSTQIQMMGHSVGYDHDANRIPSTIFTSKPANPMDWSVASNDSLFSIHMGNSSFSRDHVFVLYKSTELPRLEDVINVPPSLDTVIEAENIERKSEESENCSELIIEELADDAAVEPAMLDSVIKAVLEDTEKNIKHEEATPVEEIRNSTSSTRSLQFPVLAAENAGSTSVKVGLQKQTSQVSLDQWHRETLPQTPKATPKASRNDRFRCFSRCSFRPWRRHCGFFC